MPAPSDGGNDDVAKRSESLANHPLASVASLKHAEIVLMRHFDVTSETTAVTVDAKAAYKMLYAEERRKHFEAGTCSLRFDAPHQLWVSRLRVAAGARRLGCLKQE